MERRRFLACFVIGAAALAAGCSPNPNADSSCYTPDGCSPIAASAGLNQFDMLELIHNGTPPTDRIFSFAVLRDGQLIEPDRSEFEIAPAPEGTAADRSYDRNATELYTFKDGETVVFYEVLPTT